MSKITVTDDELILDGFTFEGDKLQIDAAGRGVLYRNCTFNGAHIEGIRASGSFGEPR